jgi:MarR family transcriptional regulator, transcriptional regulator for hemolysin
VADSDYDFDESIGYWLTLATQAYHRSLSERLQGDGITFRQMQVIGWLKAVGPMSHGDLARRMMIEPPTLVRILDRMEQSGWLERTGDQADRRRRIIRLTADVEPVWDRITECALELRQTSVDGLTQEETETFKRLLRRIHANLTAAERTAARV